MSGPLIVESELVHASAVVGRCGRAEALGLVDVAEAGQVHARRVDGGREDHHVLSGKERAAIVSLAPAYRVVGREDGGEAPVQLRNQPQDDVVDKGGGVPVLRLLVGAGAEEAQPRLVEAGDGHDLDRPLRCHQAFHPRLGVNV